jgi:hypothetical protein
MAELCDNLAKQLPLILYQQFIVSLAQALEWVQGQIQDLILDNGTTDWPLYDNDNVK